MSIRKTAVESTGRPVVAIRDMVRLIRPGILAAVCLATAAGLTVSGSALPTVGTILATLASVALAAAGSAIANACIEADSDLRMKRLERRTAALERLGRERARASALVLIAAGIFLSGCLLPVAATLLLLLAVFWYALLYSFVLKRCAFWGAVTGGVSGALPVLVGAAAVGSPLASGPLVLFAIMLVWQPPHYWSLALDRRDDYRAAGIPVLPDRGERFTVRLVLLGFAALVPGPLLLHAAGGCPLPAAIAGDLAGLVLLGIAVICLSRRDYRPVFTASIAYLAFLLLTLIVAGLGVGVG